MKNNDQSEVKELLASEQTFLAWLRTGLEVMAFGFVAIKFSLFTSTIMGIMLVAAGIAMIIIGYIKHQVTTRQLKDGAFKYNSKSLTVITVVIVIISLVLLAFLIEAYADDSVIK